MLFCTYLSYYLHCSYCCVFSSGRNSLDGKDGLVHLGLPDDVDICVELKDWLFALEGAQEMEERCCLSSQEVGREERSWHTTFQSVRAKAKSIPRQGKPYGTQRHPVELVTVRISPSLFHFSSLGFYFIFIMKVET